MFDAVDEDLLSSATEGLYSRQIMNDSGGLSTVVQVNSFKSMQFVYANSDHLQLKHISVLSLNMNGIRANKAFFHKVNAAKLNADYISLRAAVLYQSVLGDASFIGSDLTGITIERVLLQGAKFKDAVLDGANINMTDLRWADFTDCNLESVIINNSVLYAAVLTGTNLNGTDLQGCIFSGDSDGSEADAEIEGIDFSGCLLNEAEFGRVIADGAEFTWADISGANFEEAKLCGCDFTRATAYGTNFQHTDMQNAGFLGAILEGANISESNCSNACFYAAEMAGSHLTNTDFTNADFTNADLQEADFTGANIMGAIFKGAKLGGAVFDGEIPTCH